MSDKFSFVLMNKLNIQYLVNRVKFDLHLHLKWQKSREKNDITYHLYDIYSNQNILYVQMIADYLLNTPKQFKLISYQLLNNSIY